MERLIRGGIACHIEVLRDYPEPIPQPGTWTAVVEVAVEPASGKSRG